MRSELLVLALMVSSAISTKSITHHTSLGILMFLIAQCNQAMWLVTANLR